MSFTSSLTGTTFEAGFFVVDDEACLRETTTVSAEHAQKVTRNNRAIVPMGAIIPANDATAKGILYEDIDVTDGDAPGSIVTRGVIYGDRLPAALESAAATALVGIKVAGKPNVVRPTEFAKFAKLNVASAAGSASGKTALTVSGYKLYGTESYVYKTDATTAPKVELGGDLTGWTAWDGTAEITATTGHKITVAVKGAEGTAVGSGSATVTSKA